MVTAFIKTNRIASLDLIKLCAICGVLIIHLIGKTALGGVFWYAQAVPAFMVLMGYNCRKEINWTSFGKSYISYLFIYLVSLIIALYKGIGFSIYFLPVGFLPFSGPGAYWIILYFLFLLVSPLIYKLKQTVNASIFISLLFCIGWFFDIAWEQLGG